MQFHGNLSRKGRFPPVLLTLFAVSGHVSAHSPSGMDIWYDSDSGSLAVTLGILVILLLFCTFFAGIFRNRKVSGRIKVRTIHVWLGRVLATLAITNILFGLAGAGIF